MLIDGAVRRLDEAVLVDAREGRQRRDQADVRTFRRLDGADAAVVGRVHVAHLEARALAGQTARPKRREAALVRHLGQRVGLVHELRQLRGAEVLLDHRRDRLGVDQVVRHERLDLLRHAHALLDGALHADQTDAVLVLHELADRADAPVAEVIDVVDHAAAVAQLDQVADRLEDVALGEDLGLDRLVDLELVVQLEAADLGQVVALGVEEQVVEQVLGGLERGRITRAQAPVDLHDRLVGALQLVRQQGVTQVRADVEVVDEEDLDLLDAALAQLVELGLDQLLVALQQHLAGALVDDVARRDLARELVHVDRQAVDAGVDELADRTLGELAVLLDQGFLGLGVLDVARRALAKQELVVHLARVLLLRVEVDQLGVVEVVEQLLGRVAESAQQHGRVQLAAAIDADVEDVLVVELEVEPRAAVRDDARVVEQLARRVGLALVVVEEHARRAVELGDDDALGAVDDERAGVGHERDLAEVDLLLLDVADRLDAGLLVDVPHDQADDDLDRRGEGHAAGAALVDVVLGLLEVVRDELERAGLGEVLDREDALEHALQTDVLPLLVGDVDLEELVVGALLDVDQVRDVDDLRELCEALANPVVVLDCRRHGVAALGEPCRGPVWSSESRVTRSRPPARIRSKRRP